MRNKAMWIVRGLAIGLLAVGAIGFITMSLWNSVAAPVFGLATLNFFQALGLLLLARLFFGSFGGRGYYGGRGGHWGQRRAAMRERWMKMTPDERREFMQNRGCGPYRAQDQETPAATEKNESEKI